MKSRPTYTTLTPGRGCLHIFVADLAGGEAVLEAVRRAPAGFLSRTVILQVAPAGEGINSELLEMARYEPLVDATAAMERLGQILSNACMGTQVYLAGTEGFIGCAMKTALAAGMESDSVQAEHRGSQARRVQCVHCKGITEDVRTQPCICSHCGLTLLVRDHYSRRIAAFQGVRIDAEQPGTAPAPVMTFP